MFTYYAVFPTEEKLPPPGGLIARESHQGPLRTVLWDPVERAWTYNPRVGARFLYDDRRPVGISPVSRAEAEEIAARTFRSDLPTEAELHRICQEGAAGRT